MIIDIPTRHEYLEDEADRHAGLLCMHNPDNRWPFRAGWEVCGDCGEIVRPLDFIPVWITDYMTYTERE